MKGRTQLRQFDDATKRPHDQLVLIDQQVLNDVLTTYISDAVACGAYRNFALYLRVLSGNSPTTVQFVPQFLQEQHGRWHDHLQGPFASLYYEDTDTATEKRHVFTGLILGRYMRIKAIGTGTSSVNTFTVSAVLDLWD